MRALRRAVASDRRERCSSEICERLLAVPQIVGAIDCRRPIAVYLATHEEIGLNRFIALAARRGAVLVAPRWTGSTYALAPLGPDGTAPVVGPHGILEPAAPAADFRAAHPHLAAEVAVWLVPGLAFTNDGVRLGYGGGWYDRMMAEAAPSALRIGIAHEFQIVDDLPCEPHDICMTDVIAI